MEEDLQVKSAAQIKAEKDAQGTDKVIIREGTKAVKVLAGKETAKKTEFARLWFELGNKTEASKQAYDWDENTSRQVMANWGSKMSKDPYVIKIYNRLEEQKLKASLINSNFIKAKLAEAAELGMRTSMDDNGKETALGLGSTVSALSEINRMDGNHAAVRHQIDQKTVSVVISAGDYAVEKGLTFDEIGLALKIHQEEGLDQIKCIDRVLALREPIEGELVETNNIQ